MCLVYAVPTYTLEYTEQQKVMGAYGAGFVVGATGAAMYGGVIHPDHGVFVAALSGAMVYNTTVLYLLPTLLKNESGVQRLQAIRSLLNHDTRFEFRAGLLAGTLVPLVYKHYYDPEAISVHDFVAPVAAMTLMHMTTMRTYVQRALSA